MQIYSPAIVALLVFLSAHQLVESLGDVPLGECHQCEITCFDDCTAKYDAEIIQAEQREYEAKQRMLRTNGGGHLSARGLAGVSVDLQVEPSEDNQATHQSSKRHLFAWRVPNPNEPSLGLEIEKAENFASCLHRKRCRGHHIPQSPIIPSEDCSEFRGSSFKSFLTMDKAGCSTSEDSTCALDCFVESVNQDDAKEVTGEIEISPPSRDAEGRALLQKKNYPLRPIRLGSFNKFGMSLDFCFKSCLAVTCGCLGAPGFDTINSLYKQIKKNEDAGELVTDTKANYHYRPATRGECGGTKKANSKLYVRTSSSNMGDQGWVEICTDTMITALFGPTYDKKKATLDSCASQAPENKAYGCSWDQRVDKCVVGFFPVNVECNVQYLTDPTL